MAAILTMVPLDTDPLTLLRFLKDRDGIVSEIMTVFKKLNEKHLKQKKVDKRDFFADNIVAFFWFY